MRAGSVLVQCTYDGGNTRGMKWTCTACARRRFGLSGDDEAARVIADSNNIVILCAYLGQLAQLRDALGSKVAVVIDEQDQATLDDREGDQENAGDTWFGGSIQHVKVTSQVCCICL